MLCCRWCKLRQFNSKGRCEVASKNKKGVQLPEIKEMDVKLKFSEGRLIGWIFVARDKEGERIIDDLMSGEIPGLEYYRDRKIRPFAGGNRQYFIGFPM